MPVQFRDYYETLAVPKTASEDEIRSAFRKLARKYHPDVAKDKKAAEEKFKEINEAYEVLGDPEKRKKYDQLGANWDRPGGFQPPPQWGSLFLCVRRAYQTDFPVEACALTDGAKIEPWRSVLGSELLGGTLEGQVRSRIPRGTQGGQRFRLRERGLPGVSGKRGALYVEVQINVPKKLTEREREIWSELAKLYGA